MNCSKCGPIKPLLAWETFADGKRHIRATCPSCRRHIRWAEQTQGTVEEADRASGVQTPWSGWVKTCGEWFCVCTSPTHAEASERLRTFIDESVSEIACLPEGKQPGHVKKAGRA